MRRSFDLNFLTIYIPVQYRVFNIIKLQNVAPKTKFLSRSKKIKKKILGSQYTGAAIMVEIIEMLDYWVFNLIEYRYPFQATSTVQVRRGSSRTKKVLQVQIFLSSLSYGWNHRSTTWTSILETRALEGVRTCRLVCSKATGHASCPKYTGSVYILYL